MKIIHIWVPNYGLSDLQLLILGENLFLQRPGKLDKFPCLLLLLTYYFFFSYSLFKIVAIMFWRTELPKGVNFPSCIAQDYAARLPHRHWSLSSGAWRQANFLRVDKTSVLVFLYIWAFSLFWFLETSYVFLQDELCIQKSGHLIPASKPVLCSTADSNKPRATGNFSSVVFFFFKQTHSLKYCSLI